MKHSVAPPRADRGSDLPEQHNKESENTFDGPVFGYVGFEIILGTIFDVLLELKMHLKSQCDSLLAPWVAILAFF